MLKLSGKTSGAVKRPRFVEGAANVGKFLRRRYNDAGKRAGTRFRHPGDKPDAKILQHVARVALAPKDAEALRGLRKFAANDRFEQFVLGPEIGIECALGDARGAR